ncbi:MAG: type IX secretion system outer membrane channel protein PorV [Thermaurantimonas sp.]|uniref:type IX secretion system outer membrane channel protein PorV n=1 Tax=Thermaurantimonas sp. TaxID=2681568 RepID=UPI00391B16EF
MKHFFAFVLFFSFAGAVNAQQPRPRGFDRNVVTTSVPFLAISPDSRSGAMGDVGVSTTVDAFSMYWNPAKLAFLDDGDQILSISYNPLLSRLVPDINMTYVTYNQKLSNNQAFGVGFRYFTLGEIQFTDENNQNLFLAEPNEFAIDAGYSLKFSENLSGAIALRYIYSNLTQGQQLVNGIQTQPGQAFAADIAVYYMGNEFPMEGGQTGRFTAGANISNIGNKIRYTETGRADFIPTNLRIGGGFLWGLDQYNQLRFHLELNKLLVPTPPQRDQNDSIIAGKDDDVNVIRGIFQSFNDAPGGFNEELREFLINTGVEFLYDNTFALRAGYQFEHESKGGRKYFTVGFGLRYSMLSFDFSYLIPQSAIVRSPLENTLRFSLGFNFKSKK